MRQRREEQRRRPGIVEQGGDAARLRHRADAGHVLHLEGQRARALHEDGAGRVRQQGFDFRRGRQRIVITGGDAIALEPLVAERPGRAVDAVDHQQFVAGIEPAQQRERHRRRTRRKQPRARRARFQAGQRFGQRPLGRRAVAAVAQNAVGGRVGGFHRGDVLEQHRRGARHRHVDHALQPLVAPPAVDEFGIRPDASSRAGAFGILGHGAALPCLRQIGTDRQQAR